jgi:transposase InsO family protein
LRRKLEYKVKRRAVAFRQCLDRGSRRPNRPSAAELLGLGSCLDDWTRRWAAGRLGPEDRGRPAAQAPSETLAKVADILNDLGPATSVATLIGLCPELGRNEAARLLEEWLWQCREDYRATVTALQWMKTGTVWAMDHTRPPRAVDDLYPYVLIVRDLAGHFQVGTMPQQAATGRAVADALVDLFERHGAPLVLKFDNHGAFTGPEVRDVMERYGVLPLVSPAYRPQYNGAVEAGGGQFKTRAHILAAKMNHPERWTADDVEGARIVANQILRPWGKDGPTPGERWKTRTAISDQEREKLRRVYDARLAEFERDPSLCPAHEGGAFFQVSRRSALDVHGIDGNRASPDDALPPWARKVNAAPGHRRPALAPALPLRVAAKRNAKRQKKSRLMAGQRRKNVVQYQRMKRASLTDALVAAGLLVIRKRRIPLPIHRLKRLNFS